MSASIRFFSILLMAHGFLLSISRTVPYEGFQPSQYWALWFGIGLMGYAFGAAKEIVSPPRRSKVGYFVPLLVTIFLLFVLPLPYGLACWPIAATLGAELLSKGRQSVQTSLIRLSMIVAAWIPIWLAYERVSASIRSVDLLGPLVALLFNVFGLKAWHSGSSVFVDYQFETVEVGLWIPDLFPLLFLFAMTGLAMLFPMLNLRRYGLAAITFLGICLIRFIVISDYAQVTGSQDIRTSELLVLISSLPVLVVVLLVYRRFKPEPVIIDSRQLSIRVSLALVSACVAVGIGLAFDGPSSRGEGRVLIQEYNSIWEPTNVPINTKEYGVRSVYTYFSWVRELENYYDVSVGSVELTDERLLSVDILILKCPTAPYSSKEIDAVVRFVGNGGGLWLIGDHTNVFGMNSYLNQIASRFDIEFEADAVSDPHYGRQLYGVGSYLTHPAVQGLGPNALMYTSCSLRSSVWQSGNVFVGKRVFIDNPDYSVNTFFGNFELESSEYFGSTVQAIARPWQSGRVAAWTDSTMYSNFSVFMPGTMEMSLSTIDWLNRDGGWQVGRASLLVGLAGILICIIVVRASWKLLVIPATLGLLLGTWVGSILSLNAAPLPTAKVAQPTVAFLLREKSPALPLVFTSDETSSISYLTTFVAVQRIGSRPFVAHDLDRAMKAPIICMPGRDIELTDDDFHRLRNWVEQGGHLICLDGSRDKENLMRFAETFDIDIQVKQMVSEVVTSTTAKPLGRQPLAYFLAGDHEPIVVSRLGSVVGKFKHGKGNVLISTTHSLFSDESLGVNSSIPNAAQSDLLHLLYAAFKSGS